MAKIKTMNMTKTKTIERDLWDIVTNSGNHLFQSPFGPILLSSSLAKDGFSVLFALKKIVLNSGPHPPESVVQL